MGLFVDLIRNFGSLYKMGLISLIQKMGLFISLNQGLGKGALIGMGLLIFVGEQLSALAGYGNFKCLSITTVSRKCKIDKGGRANEENMSRLERLQCL